jgi:hypothetical protein
MGWWRNGDGRPGLARVAALAAVSLAVSVVAVQGTAIAAGAATSSPRWTGSKLPLPAGAATNSFRPMAISCSSATRCAGGGSYAEAASFPPALLTLSGKKWTDTKAPLPAGARANQPPETAVVGVACPAATTCFAGGHYSNARGGQAMLLAWSGKRWTAVRAPLPAEANSNPGAVVSGISCPSATWCTAVGEYEASPHGYGLILRRSKGKWTAAAAPAGPGGAAVGLNAVSCPAVTRCFAGGGSDYADGTSTPLLMLTWWKNKWTVVQVALPKNAAANPQAGIDAIACPTATRCIAAGSYENSAGDQEGLLLAWSGRNWTASTAPVPANAGADPWTSLNAAACPVSSRCVVGGEYEDAASQPHGLLLTWSHSNWAAAEAPAGYDVHAISCPTASRCFALSAVGGGLELLTGP